MKTFAKTQKSQFQFNVIFRNEAEGGFTVLVPALPGCITYGKNLAEAKRMAEDAIKGYIISLQKRREPIPSDENSFISSIQFPKTQTFSYA